MAVRLSALHAGRATFIGRKIDGTHFCWRLSRPKGHSAARSRSIEKSSDLIGSRTRDFSSCALMPQPITLQNVPQRMTGPQETFQTDNVTKCADVTRTLMTVIRDKMDNSDKRWPMWRRVGNYRQFQPSQNSAHVIWRQCDVTCGSLALPTPHTEIGHSPDQYSSHPDRWHSCPFFLYAICPDTKAFLLSSARRAAWHLGNSRVHSCSWNIPVV
jgi:hypothetical protein